MVFTSPLNLEELLLNNVLGSVTIFIFASTLFISIMAAKFRMSPIIFGLFIILFSLMFQAYVGGITLLILVIFALVAYTSFDKITN